MANLPATKSQSSSLNPRDQKLLSLLEKGWQPNEIATRLHPEDMQKRRAVRRRARALAFRSPAVAEQQGAAASGAALMALEDVTDAVVRRAKRGRVDAARLVYGITGFYEPTSKVKNEHSGEVVVKVVAGRPARQLEEPVVDAEVVED